MHLLTAATVLQEMPQVPLRKLPYRQLLYTKPLLQPGTALINVNARATSFIIPFTPHNHPVRRVQLLSTILQMGKLRHVFT